jgi:CHAT domain-containing protein
MLLMDRFYEYHIDRNMSPAQALSEAQRWLRTVTGAELSELFDQYADLAPDRPRMPYKTAEKLFREYALVGNNAESRPFSEPYFWAAFSFAGN